LPALLSDLLRVPARRATAGSFAKRLAATPETERHNIALELVRSHVAAVLGHSSPEAIDPERAFKELGVDSLGAVELRNRLAQASSLRLPSTLIFDYPTPAAIADHLRSQLVDGSKKSLIDEELDKLEAVLASVGADGEQR